jgi:hypothetical protein
LISYHEAGHAVVARKLGVKIADVDTTADDNDCVANVQTRSAVWMGRLGARHLRGLDGGACCCWQPRRSDWSGSGNGRPQ